MVASTVASELSQASIGLPALALLLSYLLGSVPWGWLLARLLKDIDLRSFGSGNIGSTNAVRAMGKPLGFLAFFLDFAKGWLPVAVIAPRFSEAQELAWMQVLCGAAAVAGHVWPLYLGFKGGKAVATGMGAVVALDPLIFVLGGGAWLITLYSTGFVSLASIAMGLTFPLVAWWRAGEGHYGGEVVIGTLALAALILVRHRGNLSRIFAGTEPRRGKQQK